MNGKKIGIIAVIVIVVLCIIGAVALGGLKNLLGGKSSANTAATSQAQGSLGALYVSDQVDSNGCPLGQTSSFASDQPIYAGLERSRIPGGTDLFMRLSYNGQPLEDSDPITAPRDMDGCVWFEFSPSAGQVFQSGSYSVQLIVNGNPTDQMAFSVSGQGQGAAANPSGAQMGRLVTTTKVGQDGCPTDDVEQFYSDESIYVSLEKSFIPAGTELFARLNYQGQAIEDTDVIRAERDRDSCVWFVFEPSGNFDTGNYSVDLFVNGSLYESLPVEIQ